jgi:hypothetical protein
MVMAMSINGKYQNNLVTEPDWRALAGSVGVCRTKRHRATALPQRAESWPPRVPGH